jgi:hypothetical protein
MIARLAADYASEPPKAEPVRWLEPSTEEGTNPAAAE